jgi:hypothetical protein
MPPELDELSERVLTDAVAREVMGWNAWRETWAPARNLQDAWEVVGKLREDRIRLELADEGVRAGRDWWRATFFRHGKLGQAQGETPSEAICKAALVTVRAAKGGEN